jgi:hypothetical protein
MIRVRRSTGELRCLITIQYEIAVSYATAIRYQTANLDKKTDIDHIAEISRERIDTRKRTPYDETRSKSCKSTICISFEYEREKAGCPRIRRKRKTLRKEKSTRYTEANSRPKDSE